MSDRGLLPEDARGQVYNRAQGRPILSTKKIGSAEYRDIFDLSSYGDRVFTGIAVQNPDATNSITISMGGFDCGAADACIRVHPSGFLVFDQMTFGPTFYDVVAGLKVTRIRALLSATSGTLATGTYNYNNGGSPVQPADGDTVTINGTVYEFSSDASATPGRVKVDIGGAADTTWTSLVTAINANDSEVTASINTGTDIVTITSNLGGTDGNAQTIAQSASLLAAGVAISGATLASGANGLQPVIHIW